MLSCHTAKTLLPPCLWSWTILNSPVQAWTEIWSSLFQSNLGVTWIIGDLHFQLIPDLWGVKLVCIWQETLPVSKKNGLWGLTKKTPGAFGLQNGSCKTTFGWFTCIWIRNMWIKFPVQTRGLKISGESVWQSVSGIWMKLESFFMFQKFYLLLQAPQWCDWHSPNVCSEASGGKIAFWQVHIEFTKGEEDVGLVRGVTAIYKNPKPSQTIISWNKGMGKQDSNYTGDKCCGTVGFVLMTSALPSQPTATINIGVTFTRRPLNN